MVDYSFYNTVYLGSSIPQKAFDELAARASEILARLKRHCRVSSAGEDSEKMALCAMAEALYHLRRRQGVRSTSVGGVSVSYEQPDSLRSVYQAAQIYLDIYRGAGK